MIRLLLTFVLASFAFTAAYAGEVETTDYINANMTWADNEEFQRVNNAQAYEIASFSDAEAENDWINANMLWADDKEFQVH